MNKNDGYPQLIGWRFPSFFTTINLIGDKKMSYSVAPIEQVV